MDLSVQHAGTGPVQQGSSSRTKFVEQVPHEGLGRAGWLVKPGASRAPGPCPLGAAGHPALLLTGVEQLLQLA